MAILAFFFVGVCYRRTTIYPLLLKLHLNQKLPLKLGSMYLTKHD